MGEKTIEELIASVKKMAEAAAQNPPTPISGTESSQDSCPLCDGTGWIRCEIAEGYMGVRPCACQKTKSARAMMRKSGLDDALATMTFDTFETKTPIQQAMKKAAEEYLNEMLGTDPDTPRKPWMYIGGNPGSGKTHICTALCGEMLKNGIEVRYMQWGREARRLKALINEPDFDEQIDGLITCGVLYIDDLLKTKWTKAVQPSGQFTASDIKLAFSILNGRYIRNLPTVITSEWDLLDDLMAEDEGTFSRVYERCKRYTVSIARTVENNYRLRRAQAAGRGQSWP